VEEKVVDWSAIVGVVAGAVVANLVHWGFASINGMVVAAICWSVGQLIQKRK
jgi:cytosine permease